MKRFLIFSLLAILAISIILPLVSSCCYTGIAVSMATMLSGLCGLATLYIAILLYDRYGVEAKAKEKIMDAVNAAIEEIQKVNFVLIFNSDDKDDNAPKVYVVTLSFHSKKDFVTESLTPEALSSTLYYKYSGMYGCSQLCQRTQSNIFLPQSIVEAIQQLNVFTYEKQMVSEGTYPLTVLSAYSDEISNNADTLDGKDTFIPKQGFSLVQFIDAYFGVKESIIKWYKDNGIDTTNLNL